jgi:hypothetical protein
VGETACQRCRRQVDTPGSTGRTRRDVLAPAGVAAYFLPLHLVLTLV